MALRIVRKSVGLRPRTFGGGRSAEISSNSASDISVEYRSRMTSYFARSASFQGIANLPKLLQTRENQTPRGRSTNFRSGSKLDFAHFCAPVSDGGPKDRGLRDEAHGLFGRQVTPCVQRVRTAPIVGCAATSRGFRRDRRVRGGVGEAGGPRGFDAGKKIKGRKRHI